MDQEVVLHLQKEKKKAWHGSGSGSSFTHTLPGCETVKQEVRSVDLNNQLLHSVGVIRRKIAFHHVLIPHNPILRYNPEMCHKHWVMMTGKKGGWRRNSRPLFLTHFHPFLAQCH
jgi:hypothetical protein